MIWFILTHLACTDTKTTETDTSSPQESTDNRLIMATVAMDYSVGALATFDLDTETLTENVSSISGDPVVVMDSGLLWQLNRYQYDTLRKYDPSNLQVPLKEVSLAPEVGSSNPHDVAVCGGNVFVSLYGVPSLPILNIDTLETIESIDLSQWSDEDDIPEASSLVVVDDQLFVGLQRLDRSDGFSPLTSVALQIDCNTNAVVNSWEMGSNIEVIEWNDGVALITQSTDTEEAGILVWENSDWNRVWTADGNISATAYQNDTLFYSSLNTSQTEYVLHCANLSTGTHNTSEPWSEYITDLLIEDGTTGLVAAHWGWSDPSNSSPGLYRVNLDTCTVESHWPMELGPFSMVHLH